jgi:FkbM family methyltransferase
MNGEELLGILEDEYENEISDFTIVQIGANDGMQDDPIQLLIKKYSPKAHLVEPVKELYKTLTTSYTDCPNVTCHNFAISDIDGEKKMITVDYDDSLPLWCKGLSTFDISRNFLSGFGGYKLLEDLRKTEIFKKVKKAQKEISVQTKTLDTFFLENKIETIDVFITDTEGHDFIIFNQLDLTKYFPKLIMMETHTLGNEDKISINKKLLDNGYTILQDSWDIIAKK